MAYETDSNFRIMLLYRRLRNLVGNNIVIIIIITLKRACFIDKFLIFLLLISTLSFLLFLYAVSWNYKRDYLHANIDILFYIIFYIINTMEKHYTLFHHVHIHNAKRSRLEPSPLPLIPLFVTTPLNLDR